MFAKARRRRDSSSSTPTVTSQTPVSPLQQDFDFALNHSLHSPVSVSSEPFRPSADSLRPRTGDGPASRRSVVSLQPPVLPPIPRVASRHETSADSIPRDRFGHETTADSTVRHRSRPQTSADSTSRNRSGQETGGLSTERHGSDEASTSSRKSELGLAWDFNPSFDWQHKPSMDRQEGTDGQSQHDARANPTALRSLLDINFDSPRMEASMFPRPEIKPPGDPFTAGPAMTRSFIDSRDKPYSQPAPRPPPIQSSYSSPDLLLPRPSATLSSSVSPRSPLSPYSAASGSSRPSPKSASSPNDPNKAPSLAATNYSGSTARASTRSTSSTAASPLQHQTIGTPYQQTSPSFPAPQLVATRPKTMGSSSTVAGVMVPTHHTGSHSQDKGKPEKRKTRLLNPMALLVRRRSGQDTIPVPDEEELRVRAQAQARQKRVASLGVNQMPEDFDPRIRGKIVHDFNVPRPQRNYSYSDADRRPVGQLQSANSAPLLPLPPGQQEQEQPPSQSKQSSDVSSRYSRHTPIFVEHLFEDPNTDRRVSSVQAEQLENREFLSRASRQSSHSAFSQESPNLPPFARRSQQMDPLQASFFRDDESKRSSDPSSGNDRNSNLSSVGLVSPLTALASNPLIDARMSTSPISPESPDKAQKIAADTPALPRTTSEVQNDPPCNPAQRTRQGGMIVKQHVASASQPAVSTVGNQVVTAQPPRKQDPAPASSTSPDRISREAPGTIVLPQRDIAMVSSSLSTPRIDSSAASTPELATVGTAVAVKSSTSPAKLVEKRASAVGHSRRTSNGPRHHVSNASRFSFQMGESAAEERVLEDKHRKMAANCELKAGIPDEDDEDYFDEDAMDDEDEMEVMQRRSDTQPPHGLSAAREYLQPPQEHVHDSDDGSVYEDDVPDITREHELTYAMHPAFRTHSAIYSSRGTSVQPSLHRSSGMEQYMPEGYNPHHQRYFSDASVMTVGAEAGNGAFVQDNLSPTESMPGGVGAVKPRSDFYMQPRAAGYSATASPVDGKKTELPIASRGSEGAKAKEELGSPMSVMSAGTVPSRASLMSASTIQSARSPGQELRTAATTVSPESPKEMKGLGMGGFSDFVFTDGPDLSLDNTPATSPQNLSRPQTAGNRNTADSMTLPHNGQWNALRQTPLASPFAQQSGWDNLARSPGLAPSEQRPQNTTLSASGDLQQSAAYRGSVGHGIRARNAATNQNQQYSTAPASESEYEAQDDMYFDDGGFEADVNNNDQSQAINENDFDNPGFLGGFKGMEPRGHQRDKSAMTITSLSSDGPYPTFAIPNPAKARQRDSRMLLEDLPLQTAVDPKWIPQRNPSEDAKRLGLSSKVPPLPAQSGSRDSLAQMQNSLYSYHQALADAANKAAAEGRFVRQASIASARSASLYSNRGEEVVGFQDDRSHYSQDEAGVAGTEGSHTLGSNLDQAGVERSLQDDAPKTRFNAAGITYSPSKLNFDFGFNDNNTAPSDFEDYAADDFDDDDDFMNDPDVIAAANAEALANDDDGFYGQEFGFYAKARPNSSDSAEAINGGFFGAAGDDGLARNKSLREPNLTPITERSEFSTRNSFISLGHLGPSSTGPWAAGYTSPSLARIPISPLAEGDVMNFEQLRKVRAGAFGGGSSNASSPVQRHSGGPGYFGSFPAPGPGGTPGGHYSTESSNSRDSPARASGAQNWQESPNSTSSSGKGMPFSPTQPGSGDYDATPRKAVQAQEPTTARKVSAPVVAGASGHSRQSSGADSVTYVREQDPSSPGQPRWVLERRRTSQLGTELVGREFVKGGWI